jgi:hypothetical protein
MMSALLRRIMQKGKLRIISDPSNIISKEDTGNANAQMPKPGVDHRHNPAKY